MASSFGFKLTADTAQAQRQIQELSKKVDEFDAKTRKKRSISASTSGTGKAAAPTTSPKAGGGGGMLGGSFGGGMLGGMIGGMNPFGMIAQNIPTLVGALGRVIPGVGDGLRELTNAIRGYVESIEILEKPHEEAMKRGDSLDALDDQKRMHNSASNAEEYAWQAAMGEVMGNGNYEQVLNRVQNLIDMTNSGSISEAEEALKKLDGSGLTLDDMKNSSSWAILQKLIEAYAQGNFSAKQAQDIFGARAMGLIRKAGDGSGIRAKYDEHYQHWKTKIEPYEQTTLEATDYAETVRNKAKALGYIVRDDGTLIRQGADNEYSKAERDLTWLSSEDERAQALAEFERKMTPPEPPPPPPPIPEDATQTAMLHAINKATDIFQGIHIRPRRAGDRAREEAAYDAAWARDMQAIYATPPTTMEREAAYDAAWERDMQAIWGIPRRPRRAGDTAREEAVYDKAWEDSMKRAEKDAEAQKFAELIKVLEKNAQHTENLNNTMQRATTEASASFN